MKKILVILFLICVNFIYSQDSCSDTICVPNAFTPTLTTNAKFLPSCTNSYTDYQMVVYNRWGNILFSGKEWDGTFNGEILETGVFIWEITAWNVNCQKTFIGSVTLIKF